MCLIVTHSDCLLLLLFVVVSRPDNWWSRTLADFDE
jgi:hypothetical protein